MLIDWYLAQLSTKRLPPSADGDIEYNQLLDRVLWDPDSGSQDRSVVPGKIRTIPTQRNKRNWNKTTNSKTVSNQNQRIQTNHLNRDWGLGGGWWYNLVVDHLHIISKAIVSISRYWGEGEYPFVKSGVRYHCNHSSNHVTKTLDPPCTLSSLTLSLLPHQWLI